ncbi:MAG: hypothetical protein ACI4OR_01240 [Alphaproteobacteria bacterium]
MNLKKIFMHPLFGAAGVLFVMGLYFGISYALRAKYGAYDLDKAGITEALTYLFYGMSFAVLVGCYGDYIHTPRQSTYFGLIFLWVITLLREMGAQHWIAINDTTAIKINYFKNPNVPFYGKMVSAVLILTVVSVIAFLFYKNFKKMVQGFFKFNPMYWTIATFGGWGLITQIADRFNSNYAKMTGERLSEPALFFVTIIEEGGESLLPLLLIIALMQFHLQLKKNHL